jgi:hypothetical protein
VYKLHVATNHVNSVSYADGLITWGHVPPDAVSGETKIKDNFIAWNSNVYTLDYLVEWWFYKIAPSPTEFEWGGDCRFEYDPVVKCNVITIATLAVDTDYYFDLPPAPPDYWTPPPL